MSKKYNCFFKDFKKFDFSKALVKTKVVLDQINTTMITK